MGVSSTEATLYCAAALGFHPHAYGGAWALECYRPDCDQRPPRIYSIHFLKDQPTQEALRQWLSARKVKLPPGRSQRAARKVCQLVAAYMIAHPPKLALHRTIQANEDAKRAREGGQAGPEQGAHNTDGITDLAGR